MTATTLPAATTSPASTAAVDTVDTDLLLRRVRRAGLWAIGIWLAAFGAWAALAPISGAVVGSGVVKVEANRLTVSHRDGGIVAQVLVREGQQVAQGDPLLVLEDTRIDASVELLQVQLQAERLRKSRLDAEIELRPSWTPPAIDAAVASAERVRETLRGERQAFEARRRALQGQLQSLQGQLVDLEHEAQAYERDIAASAEALELLREELASNEALLQENFVNRTRVLSLRRGVAEYESRIQNRRAELAQAQQRRAELAGRVQTVKDAYVQAASDDLRDATAKIVDLEERLRASRDSADRQVVVAPSSGRLVDLRINTAGSAIGPREPIVDIVPSGRPLVVEARLPPHAISDVVPGLKAEVQLLSMKQRFAGTLAGEVVYVSADALSDPRTGMTYMVVHVQVPPEELAAAGNMTLLPGMTAEVYIKTVERSTLGFLLDPLTMAMRRSLREF